MNVRERIEQEELERLSSFATPSVRTRGRDRELQKDDFRTEFQRDRDRIIHCKSFRRLKFKTQVFLAPEGDHYRTRLTHTLEVSQVARTLARCLRLNEDLSEAIALGHDLGHTPFGHTGERALDRLLKGGFRHNEQSQRVVEVLEYDGDGLNLTKEVRDGIRCHSGTQLPMTLEGECVRRADRIAYLNHDLDDAIRAGVLKPHEIPGDILRILGDTHSKRIATMISDLVVNSENQPELKMSPLIQEAMDALRAFMFDHVYKDDWRKDVEPKCEHVVDALFRHYLEHPAEMPEEYVLIGYRDGVERAAADYLSGMTDRYAIRQYENLFVPVAFPNY